MYEDWLTLDEVIEKTHLSRRTLQRKIEQGELKKGSRNVPGRRPLTAQSQHLCYERQCAKRNEGISNSYPRSLSATVHALAAPGVGRNIWNLQNFFSTLRLTAQLLGLGR
jgi:hypothetical protein